MTLKIVISAYNEEERIGDTIDSTLGVDYVYTPKIIVVNDGSTDNTSQIVERKKGVTMISHNERMGKGKSIIDGCDFAVDRRAKYLVLMDADGQHDPQYFPELVNPLIRENVDVVLGSRYLRKIETDLFSPRERERFLVNRTFVHLLNEIIGLTVSDPFCGYRALTTRAYMELYLRNPGYGIELETLIKAHAGNMNMKEVPVPRIYGENTSKMMDILGTKLSDRLECYINSVETAMEDVGLICDNNQLSEMHIMKKVYSG